MLSMCLDQAINRISEMCQNYYLILHTYLYKKKLKIAKSLRKNNLRCINRGRCIINEEKFQVNPRKSILQLRFFFLHWCSTTLLLLVSDPYCYSFISSHGYIVALKRLKFLALNRYKLNCFYFVLKAHTRWSIFVVDLDFCWLKYFRLGWRELNKYIMWYTHFNNLLSPGWMQLAKNINVRYLE